MVEENPVAGKKMYKQGGSTALIAIAEWVIFHREVEQIRGFELDGGVELVACETLVESVDNTLQRFAAFLADQCILRKHRQPCRLTVV